MDALKRIWSCALLIINLGSALDAEGFFRINLSRSSSKPRFDSVINWSLNVLDTFIAQPDLVFSPKYANLGSPWNDM